MYKTVNLLETVKTSQYFKYLNTFLIDDNTLLIESNDEQKIVFPKRCVTDFVNRIHKDLCRVGIKKTKYVSDYFFWSNMIMDIQNVIRECHFCMNRKVSSEKVKENSISRYAGNPMEQIVIDVVYMDNLIYVYITLFESGISVVFFKSQVNESNHPHIK